MENHWPSKGTFFSVLSFEVFFRSKVYQSNLFRLQTNSEKLFIVTTFGKYNMFFSIVLWCRPEWEGTRVKYLLWHWQFPTIRKMGGIENALHMRNVQNLDILH